MFDSCRGSSADVSLTKLVRLIALMRPWEDSDHEVRRKYVSMVVWMYGDFLGAFLKNLCRVVCL